MLDWLLSLKVVSDYSLPLKLCLAIMVIFMFEHMGEEFVAWIRSKKK